MLDENQKLVGTLSASDLRGYAPFFLGPFSSVLILFFSGLTDETLSTLLQPVNQFISNAGQKGPIRCFPDDKLDMAINKLVESKVHRLWVTDENDKPVGVLSLTDVIRTVLL